MPSTAKTFSIGRVPVPYAGALTFFLSNPRLVSRTPSGQIEVLFLSRYSYRPFAERRPSRSRMYNLSRWLSNASSVLGTCFPAPLMPSSMFWSSHAPSGRHLRGGMHLVVACMVCLAWRMPFTIDTPRCACASCRCGPPSGSGSSPPPPS